MFVETLDKCFENVCELDLIFHMEKVNITSYPPLHSGIKGRGGTVILPSILVLKGDGRGGYSHSVQECLKMERGGGNVKSSSIRIKETEKI